MLGSRHPEPWMPAFLLLRFDEMTFISPARVPSMILMGLQATLKKTFLFFISFLVLLPLQNSARSQTPLSFSDLESIQSTSGASWASDGNSLYLTSRNGLYQVALVSGKRNRVIPESGFSGTPVLSCNQDYLAAAHGEMRFGL